MRCGWWRKALITTSLHSLLRKPSSILPFSPPPRRSFQSSLDLRLESHLPYPSSHLTDDFCSNLLSFCTSSKSARSRICAHSPIIKLGIHDLLSLNNQLLTVYCKFCGLDSARKLFDELIIRDVVTWTIIISAYGRARSHEEAFRLFKSMLDDDSPTAPNEFTFSSAISCAASLRSLDSGAQLHGQVQKRGFEVNEVVASALLDFYAKCSGLKEALDVFSAMECRDAISWTAMISALVEAGDWSGAMRLYSLMIESGTPPTEFTFGKLLIACRDFFGIHGGLMLHAHMILWGVQLNVVLKTALVDMYLKCHRMNDALKVFDRTKDSDVMLWTTMISGFSQAQRYQEAISMFLNMKNTSVRPHPFTFAAVLSACTSALQPELGRQLHCRVVKAGLEDDVSVSNSLVDLYAKYSSDPADTFRLFEAIASPNVVSWTAFIAGLIRHGYEDKAFSALAEMRVRGVEPNDYTLSSVLSNCSSAEAPRHARKLHTHIVKTMAESPKDLAVVNSLVDAYARFGQMEDAWAVASTMLPRIDALAYTSLAKGFNHVGLHRSALNLIARMREEGVKIDGYSLACFLSSAAGLAAMELGRQLHGFAVKLGLPNSISVSNGLVDMYGKCGSIEEARRVFMAIEEPNVVSWNGLISSLASNGLIREALSTFEEMRMASVQPDGVTFLLVLYACSHGGLIDAGIEYFDSMHEVYGVMPQPYHYVCLVDMLGRAGRLEAATSAIETMPYPPDALIYKTLLASCRQHGNLLLGECTARKALEIDPLDPAIYVLLAGIYDDAGKVEWGEQTRRMMSERAKRKCMGQSWV